MPLRKWEEEALGEIAKTLDGASDQLPVEGQTGTNNTRVAGGAGVLATRWTAYDAMTRRPRSSESSNGSAPGISLAL
jgi:hypothetical protein